MDKKTSFVLYPADFLAAVHNFRKNEVADLIIALCETNFYGGVSFKMSGLVRQRFEMLQETIEKNNAKYLEMREMRQANGAKGGSKRQAKLKQSSSKTQATTTTFPSDESEKENESVNVNDSGEKDKAVESVDKQEYVGAPSVDEVAAYAKESGYTIDPVAFVRWNEERGWMNGKKYIALDWKKAVRKWFCKENGLEFSEMETMADNLIINDTGTFKTHSSVADCGVTGRKLACDFYGTSAPIGGGSPWTKDGSKADVTLNLYARKLAVQYLADNDECFVYLSSCIGRFELPSAVVKTFKYGICNVQKLQITKRPSEIIEELGLNKPIFAKLCQKWFIK